MSMTSLKLNATWRINVAHILYLKQDPSLDGEWQIGLPATLVPASKLYVSQHIVAEFREAMPRSFIELRPVGQEYRVLMNMAHVTGVERTELPGIPGSYLGSLPAASAMYEQSLNASPKVIARQGSKYAFYVLVGDKRMNIMTLTLDQDPFDTYERQVSEATRNH